MSLSTRLLAGLALSLIACSSGSGTNTGAGGSPGSAGTTGNGGTTGTGGTTGMGGTIGATGTGGTTGTGGMTGTGGSGPTGPTFDSCTCTCNCSGGPGTLTQAPCRKTGGLCTCDDACGNACVNARLGSLVSATGSCVHTDVPQLWNCSLASYHGGDGCTCGCGARDPDCTSGAASACGATCNAKGSCATNCSQIAATNNATCSDIPPTWKCSPAFYGRGDGCDCGCGAVDLDCLNATRGACDFCTNPGSCATTGCGDVIANRNEICTPPTPPASWTCIPENYDDVDDVCDCGCGALDPDCFDATRTSCERCVETGSCNFFQCEQISPTNNTVCN